MPYNEPMFYWGSSTSAHQVEGGNENDWTEWEKRNAARLAEEAPRKFGALPNWQHIKAAATNPENYISGDAVGHYERYEEDFDIAKSLGQNAHRFSLEWSRIEPVEGRFDEQELRHYRDVLSALRERGIEPFVTLSHFTLPAWLAEKGGVLATEFPAHFIRYAEKVVSALGENVRFWITMNEPEIYAFNSYYRGVWPPEERSVISFYRAIANLIRAHRRAYHLIKSMFPKSSVGAAFNMSDFQSAGGFVNNLLTKIAKLAWNEHFLRHTRRHLDFVGVNYYFHNLVRYGFNKNENRAVSDMGWEIFPGGLYYVLMELKRYRLPIFVTENGVADARDEKRAVFIRDHVAALARAKREGADVRGYFYWSLLDNFEWDKGFWPKFGLVSVDRHTMKRTMRASANEYKKIIQSTNF